MSHPGAVMNHNGPDKQQQQQPQLVSRQHESNLFMKLLINRLGIQVGVFFLSYFPPSKPQGSVERVSQPDHMQRHRIH